MKPHDPDPPSFWPSSILWHGQGFHSIVTLGCLRLFCFRGYGAGYHFVNVGFARFCIGLAQFYSWRYAIPSAKYQAPPQIIVLFCLIEGCIPFRECLIFGDEINIIQWHPHSSCPWEFSRGVPSCRRETSENKMLRRLPVAVLTC